MSMPTCAGRHQADLNYLLALMHKLMRSQCMRFATSATCSQNLCTKTPTSKTWTVGLVQLHSSLPNK